MLSLIRLSAAFMVFSSIAPRANAMESLHDECKGVVIARITKEPSLFGEYFSLLRGCMGPSAFRKIFPRIGQKIPTNQSLAEIQNTLRDAWANAEDQGDKRKISDLLIELDKQDLKQSASLTQPQGMGAGTASQGG